MIFFKTNIVHVNYLLALALVFCVNLSSQVIKVEINDANVFQTIEGFGASDAWRCKFVGEYWPKEKKEKIAEWLFSKECDENGNRKGIGLSLYSHTF